MEVKSVKVSVMGAVHKPGRYGLCSWATVMDMLAMAEGSDDAARSRIVVLRPNGRSTEVLNFDCDGVRSADSIWVNFYVRSGDIVVVP
jgi:polysaccharide export outer membrane protein